MRIPSWLYLTRRERYGLYFIILSVGVGEILLVTKGIWQMKSLERAQYSDRKEVKWPLNLNTAGYEDLLEIPGVGPVLAQRIIAFREKNGKINNLNELLKVKGIGPRLLKRLTSYLTVTDADTIKERK